MNVDPESIPKSIALPSGERVEIQNITGTPSKYVKLYITQRNAAPNIQFLFYGDSIFDRFQTINEVIAAIQKCETSEQLDIICSNCLFSFKHDLEHGTLYCLTQYDGFPVKMKLELGNKSLTFILTQEQYWELAEYISERPSSHTVADWLTQNQISIEE